MFLGGSEFFFEQFQGDRPVLVLLFHTHTHSEMPNIENYYGQYQDQDQYQVDFFLPILGLVLGLAPKKVPNILEIVLEKGLGFIFF